MAQKWLDSVKADTVFSTASFGTTTATIYDWSRDALWISEGHRRLPNGGWSGGGGFLCIKEKQSHGTKVSYNNQYQGNRVSGASKGLVYVPAGPPPVVISKDQAINEQNKAKPYYATGVARTRPGRPEASLGQFLIELRDLPRIPFQSFLNTIRRYPVKRWGRVIQKQVKNYRSLGSEYLNIEFGWAPFIRDLQQIYNLMKNVDKQMAQIVRNNGRSIRRKAVLLENQSISLVDKGHDPNPWAKVYFGGYPSSFASPGGSDYYCYDSVYEKVWFSAAYRYWIPDVNSWGWNARARAALFGVLPTPELLWEVMPWSWLIDWFSNVGDVVSNVSTNAVDNLTFLYSFVMREWVQKRVAVCQSYQAELIAPDPYFGFNTAIRKHAVEFRSESETHVKSRVGGGNPFGLDVSAPSLTGRQWAILAALGISRGAVR